MKSKRFESLFGDAFDAPSYVTDEGSGILVPQKLYDDDFDIHALMDSAKDPDTGLLRDLKIEDGDLAHAGSYYDYCFSIIEEDAHPPWMMQMWIGVMLFAEYCPVCSNKKWTSLDWVLENVNKDQPSKEIAQGLQMLHHGVCPKCKRQKWDLIKNYGLTNYVELVNVLGQRAGKSASAASYTSYLTHRYLKFPKLATLTKAMQKSTELTGTFVSLTFNKALSLLWTPYMNIINESSWFCVAEDSQVTLASGDKVPIKNLEQGMSVKTLEGESKITNVFDNGVRECYDVVLENRTLTGTGSHKIRCLGPDGETLIWKSVEDLQEGDLVLTE